MKTHNQKGYSVTQETRLARFWLYVVWQSSWPEQLIFVPWFFVLGGTCGPYFQAKYLSVWGAQGRTGSQSCGCPVVTSRKFICEDILQYVSRTLWETLQTMESQFLYRFNGGCVSWLRIINRIPGGILCDVAQNNLVFLQRVRECPTTPTREAVKQLWKNLESIQQQETQPAITCPPGKYIEGWPKLSWVPKPSHFRFLDLD